MKRIIVISLIALSLICSEKLHATVCGKFTRLDASQKQHCLDKGGRVLERCCGEICILPSNDGGKVCNSYSDCEGTCRDGTQYPNPKNCKSAEGPCRCSRWLDKNTQWAPKNWDDEELMPLSNCK